MRRKGIQLCYPFEEKRLLKWPLPYLCQPKLDGDRCRAVPTPEGYKLFTSEANEIVQLPHLNDALNAIPSGNRIELDGEIYNHDLSHHELHGIVSRTQNQHEDYKKAQFHIFDCCIETLPQYDRLPQVNNLFNFIYSSYIFKVTTHLARNMEDIINLLNYYIEQGYEGIIVRNPIGPYKRKRSTDMVKFKPTRSDWYEIIGTKEEVDKDGKPKDQLGALICQGDDGTQFSVGSGLTQQQRQEWWLNKHLLIGLYCKVQYQRQNKGTPIFPVFISIDEFSGE